MKAIDTGPIIFARVPETKCCPALAIEYAKESFRIKRRWRQPGNLRSDVAQTIGAKCAIQDQRFIHKCPLLRMLRVLASEIREELASFNLKLRRQRSG